jgi:hypothetical protein
LFPFRVETTQHGQQFIRGLARAANQVTLCMRKLTITIRAWSILTGSRAGAPPAA